MAKNLLLWFVLAVCWPLAVSAQSEPDDALERAHTILAELQTALGRERNQFEAERARLRADEFKLTPPPVSISDLEEARLELAARRARIENLALRLASRRNALAQTEQQIHALELELNATDSADSPAQGALRTRLSHLSELAPVQQQLVAVLRDLHRLAERKLQLTRQSQALMQSRFELPALQSGATLPAAAPGAQAKIDRLLAQAARLHNQAAQLDPSLAPERARVRLLELEAQQAEDRAELAQLRSAHGQYQELIRTLESLAASRAIAPQILRRGASNLEAVAERLEEDQQLLRNKQMVLADQRELTQQQGEIVTGADSTLSRRLAILDGLITEVQSSREQLESLLARRLAASELYQRTIGERSQAALLEWRAWPQDGEAWSLLLDGLKRLPGRVATHLRRVLGNVFTAASGLSAGRAGTLLALLLGLSLGSFALRRKAMSWAAQPTRSTLLTIPAAVLAASLPRLLPAVLFAATAWIIALPAASAALIVGLLLVWPVIGAADLIARRLLLDEPSPEKRRLYREMRWVMLVVGTFAVLIIIALEVALSPSVRDALDRISMLCLIAIMLPALHLRSVIQARRPGIKPSGWLRFAARASLALPVLLLLCALLGLVGYVNLAWAIASGLAWLTLTIAMVLILARALSEACQYLDRRLATREDGGDFYRRYLLHPLYRLMLLIVLLGAGWLLIQLLGWNAQTPLVGGLPDLLDKVLFRVGEAQIKFGDLLLAALIVFLVFWFGDWSKQVSYRYAYARISDAGVRESLSTFTQYLVVVFGLLVALKTVGLDLTALTVFAGALGIGIGFGLQQIVVNFISGLLLLVERPLKTRDIVNVDQYEGEVTRIGIRALTVKTWDNQEVVIPNSSVITKPFTNWTHGDDVMRTILVTGISYDDDPEQAMALVREILDQHPAVLTDPAPKVLLWEFADSAMTLRLQYHTHIRGAIGRADVRSQVLSAIWKRFRSAGITIPYPQRVLHMPGAAGELAGDAGSS